MSCRRERAEKFASEMFERMNGYPPDRRTVKSLADKILATFPRPNKRPPTGDRIE